FNFNLYLNISFSNENCHSPVLELSSFALAPPTIEEFPEYIQRQYGCNFDQDSFSTFTQNFPEFSLETLIIFHSHNELIDENSHVLDILFSFENLYNLRSQLMIKKLLGDNDFLNGLKNHFQITISTWEDENN